VEPASAGEGLLQVQILHPEEEVELKEFLVEKKQKLQVVRPIPR
jgi:hypothetical protein